MDKNDLSSVKDNMDKKLAFYRDALGKSPLHVAIEKGFYEMALYLLEKYPLLSKLNDCVSEILEKIGWSLKKFYRVKSEKTF